MWQLGDFNAEKLPQFELELPSLSDAIQLAHWSPLGSLVSCWSIVLQLAHWSAVGPLVSCALDQEAESPFLDHF